MKYTLCLNIDLHYPEHRLSGAQRAADHTHCGGLAGTRAHAEFEL